MLIFNEWGRDFQVNNRFIEHRTWSNCNISANLLLNWFKSAHLLRSATACYRPWLNVMHCAVIFHPGIKPRSLFGCYLFKNFVLFNLVRRHHIAFPSGTSLSEVLSNYLARWAILKKSGPIDTWLLASLPWLYDFRDFIFGVHCGLFLIGGLPFIHEADHLNKDLRVLLHEMDHLGPLVSCFAPLMVLIFCLVTWECIVNLLDNLKCLVHIDQMLRGIISSLSLLVHMRLWHWRPIKRYIAMRVRH